MKYRICEHEQGTPGWHADRLGCVTGSMADILYASGKTKGSESTQRINYRYALAEERITGEPQADQFMSKFMKDGIVNEPRARMAYEGLFEIDVQTVGFLRLEDLFAGCSLDGATMAGGRIVGIQEFKCPMLKNHIAYLRAGVVPDDYKYQVLHNLWCTGAEWCDFSSFRHGFRLFTVRAWAKDLPIAEHDAQVRKFLREVDECEAEIRSYTEAA
jgi:hypothetical protein